MIYIYYIYKHFLFKWKTVLNLKYIHSGIFMKGVPLCVMLYTETSYCLLLFVRATDDTF